ncbi:glutamine synthetase family protein [Antarctobacter sp.]|uniref:glutamine synthetase family protein n=1 Tax=Antarctobacter sp. TaxID=1872577 RepID=UPI002B27A7ED|nr:glutamine synthetase family protein [Antarctobacter sp.]
MPARISAGRLGRDGLIDTKAAADVLDRVQAEGIETVRMVFADAHGILRGKTVTRRALEGAFTAGLRAPSTLLLKDVSHRTVFPIWSEDGDAPMTGASDVLLVPRPETFTPLPHAPHSAMMLCRVLRTDGATIGFDTPTILQGAVDRLATQGMRAVMGLEVEFQVFVPVDAALDHADATMPPRPPLTRGVNQGWQYLTETRYDAVEPLLDAVRRGAEAMGLPVLSVEIEMGPNQFEFTFDAADPMTTADRAVMFRTLVKEVCAREGYLASFMAKPRLANSVGNGWHIHQSVTDLEGRNLFMPVAEGQLSAAASAWIGGLLAHARASCIATTPTVNGYKRFAPFQLAPTRIGWGKDNRGAMLRALLVPGDRASRIENRVADSTANPYLALAFQILSGLDGVASGLEAPAPLANPYDDTAGALPATLGAAIEAFETSTMYRAALGIETQDYLVRLKRAEWERYLASISEWEQAEYFTAF